MMILTTTDNSTAPTITSSWARDENAKIFMCMDEVFMDAEISTWSVIATYMPKLVGVLMVDGTRRKSSSTGSSANLEILQRMSTSCPDLSDYSSIPITSKDCKKC